MAKQLHALLAVESSLVQTLVNLSSEAVTTYSSKKDRFQGHDKQVKFFDESRQRENTSDKKTLLTTVDEKLSHVVPAYISLYDALLSKEATNQTAKADLVVDGKVLVKDVPATMLLGLESRLKDLRGLFDSIPTLDPSYAWQADTSRPGMYRTPVIQQPKTEMRPEFIVMVQPTDKHPAMVKEWQEQVTVAFIETTHFSGMWTVARKAQVMARIDALLRGVKESRMKANTVDIVQSQIGNALFDYLLKE